VYRTSQGEETQKGISLCRGPQTEKTRNGLKVDHHYGNKKGNILDVYSKLMHNPGTTNILYIFGYIYEIF